MRYYSTQRPVAPGTFPKPVGNKVLEIVNFDELKYCPESGRDCWGYIEYEKPLTEKEAVDYELVREQLLDFNQRYMATSGTSFLRTFATAAELNEWFDAQNTDGRYFCRLYDGEKHIDILGSRYMFLKPEERWHDDTQESLTGSEEAGQTYPELSMYDEDHRLDLCRESPELDAETYEVVFEADSDCFYCFIDGCDSLLEALGLFFKDHPNITYNMVIDHEEV